MSGVPEGLHFKLLHIGVAVPAIEAGMKTLEDIFGYTLVSGPFEDPIQKVRVNFLTQAANDAAQIELIAPLTADSPINSLLNKNGGGAYHLCFETNDIEKALVHVKSKGCIIVSAPAPATAFEGRRIAWFYTPSRQLFELVEQGS